MEAVKKDEGALEAGDVAAALRVLAQIARDRTLLAALDADARVALQRLAGEVARPDLKERKKLQKALLRQEKAGKKSRDAALRGATGIQELRRAAVFATPLPALPPPGSDASAWWPRLAAEGAPAAEATGDGGDGPELAEPRKCYVCKAPYRRLHRFYDQLCPACGELNFARRAASADLRGRVALVTGARVKIGYQAAILLLRAGCTVVACTRFPRDAAARYAREPDFAAWKDRLSVYGVDLRHTPSVELLCHHLDAALPRLDFQIHNACQTVRRPPGFYAHLVERERTSTSELPPAERDLLGGHERLAARLAHDRRAAGVTAAALLSQAASDADLLLPAPGAVELFPRGVLDQDLQQVDLRAHNSWRLTLGEVPTLELLEVLLVNATAPFVMTSRLKPLMLRVRAAPPGARTSDDAAKHVVLVS
ncbi:MAG: SDR family NAD(P)-dependent oxidoreductase, partial [Anaeromyxobacteraceae bacterium]